MGTLTDSYFASKSQLQGKPVQPATSTGSGSVLQSYQSNKQYLRTAPQLPPAFAPSPQTQTAQTLTVPKPANQLGQIGTDIFSGIKSLAPKIKPTIVKGLSFALSTAKSVPSAVSKTVSKVKQTAPQKIVEAFKQQEKAPAMQLDIVLDVVKGLLGERGGGRPEVGRIGGPVLETQKYSSLNPAPTYKPESKAQAMGSLGYKLIEDIVVGNLTGINQSFETGAKSITSTPQFQFAASTIQGFTSKQFNNLLQKVKPLRITFKDLQDVTTGKGTAEQLIRFQKFNELKTNGMPVDEILKAGEKVKVSPTTRVFDFLNDTVDKIKKTLTSSFSPEEQKLLTSGEAKLKSVIGTGDKTSQELINAVINNGLEKTSEGKKVLKLAVEAQRTGNNIKVELPVSKIEVQPTKKIEVPRGQLPVGEGRVKVSSLEARVTETLKNVNQEKIDQLGVATYNQMSKKENIQAASEYVINNPEDAMKVLTGEIEPPKGVLRNSVYVAMENMARDDVELARRLASISSTRAGQEISILTEISPESPVKLIKDVQDTRIEVVEKRMGKKISQVAKEEVAKIKKQVKKIDKYDWGKFIDSIETC